MATGLTVSSVKPGKRFTPAALGVTAQLGGTPLDIEAKEKTITRPYTLDLQDRRRACLGYGGVPDVLPFKLAATDVRAYVELYGTRLDGVFVEKGRKREERPRCQPPEELMISKSNSFVIGSCIYAASSSRLSATAAGRVKASAQRSSSWRARPRSFRHSNSTERMSGQYVGLIASNGEKFAREWIQTEQSRENQNPTVAILNVGGMNHGMKQEAYGIDEDVRLLAFDLLARIVDRVGACFAVGAGMGSGRKASRLNLFHDLAGIRLSGSMRTLPNSWRSQGSLQNSASRRDERAGIGARHQQAGPLREGCRVASQDMRVVVSDASVAPPFNRSITRPFS
jgi:hypothetical protein